MSRPLAASLFGLLASACCAKPPVTTPAAAGDAGFVRLADDIYQRNFGFHPDSAVTLGLHDFDGRLPDRSPAALRAETERLTQAKAALDAIAPATLSPLHQQEREALRQNVNEGLFTLVELDAFRTNPMSYLGDVDLATYVVRDYAPLHQRAAAIIAMCKALPAYLAQARANLPAKIPATWIQTALLQTNGLADFVDHDIRTALSSVDLPLVNQAEIDPALATCKDALAAHAAWLTARVPDATADFALGEAKFLRMLAETQDVTLDLAALERIAQADLDRNTKALEAAARAIDPSKPVRDVVLAAAEDRPKPDEVLALATAQATELRQYILDHHLVSIPGDDVALVRTSPPFQRWNLAFLDGPGPFESKTLPSYYYISPPDPSWPAEEQRTYIAPRADLFFTTVHEVYPGHFVHGLHIRQNPSKILQSFCTYSTSEGWAHYVEEMMYDEGAGGQTPQQHIGQLKEALLRNVRFLVAIGLHAHGMSVDDATKLFVERGFVDAGNARQQAVRGTFDPMFLSYTLGKLMIRKLREDWKARQGSAYTIGAFHDAFLAHACEPIPVIRKDMLGDDSPPL